MREVKLLLVESPKAGDNSFVTAIDRAGYQVRVAHSVKEAETWLKAEAPDLLIYDAAWMRSTGLRTCRRWRATWPDMPIIHLRRKEQKMEESAEIDIYLQHPFTHRKLINRIRQLLPAIAEEDDVVRAGDIILFRRKGAVSVRGQSEVMLTPKLVRLLDQFMRHPNQVISRRQLMHDVWETDYVGDTRTLHVHIRWLRQIVEEDSADPQHLRTVRGQGYIFYLPPGATVDD